MTMTIGAITIDCAEPRELADFWAKALGTTIDADYDGYYIRLKPNAPGAMPLALQKVPDPTPGKNRLHLDFGVEDRMTEIKRLTELGATEKAEHSVDDFTWTILTDPAGNEFCIASMSH